ncbi:MAG: hypothetical protein ACOC0P_04235, partial [Planctomycetota bacterium]
LVEAELKNQQTRLGRMEDIEGEPGPGHYFFGSVLLFGVEDGTKIAELPKHVTRWPEPKKADEGPATELATEPAEVPEDVDAESGAIGGIKIENLGEHLKGRKVGDVVNIETTGPENHEVIPIRGRNVRVEFTIGRITKLIPAEVQDLIDMFGFEGENELRQQIKLVLNMRIESEQREVMRAQVIRHLLDNIEMELPERISESQTARIIESTRLRLQQRGIPEVTIEEKMADLRAASQQRASHDLKAQFVLERLVQDNEIQVEEHELQARIMQMAQQRGQRPDKVRDELVKNNRIYVLASQIAHEKAIDQLIDKAEVSEITAEEWNKEMGQGQQQQQQQQQQAADGGDEKSEEEKTD